MKKVIVILPTYNGAKYLEELLDSLFNQTYPLIEIYTRDDCSTDSTPKIIKKYAAKKNKGRKIIIIDNENKKLGCPDCFTELLKLANDGDYYCFCDQDDIWLPNKISDAVSKIEQIPHTTPVLHFGAYDYYTSDLKFMSHSPKIHKNVKLRNVIYDYWPLGFNITFNKALYNKIFEKYPRYIYYHDCWPCQVALGVGKFIYSPDSSVKYRRQENAVTYSNHSKLSLFFWRIHNFFGKNSNNLKQLKNILIEYKNIFRDELNDEDIKMLRIFTEDNIINYFRKIFYPHRLRIGLVDELALRFLFIIGKL